MLRTLQTQAFNVSGERFDYRLPSVPGPGAYHGAPSLVKNEVMCPSISRKGYTSLASKSCRFDSMNQAEGRSRPGPGAYFTEAPSCSTNNQTKKTQTAAFAKGKRVSST